MTKKKQDFREGFDFRGYYEGFVPDARNSGDANCVGRCPIPGHEDTNASFSFNTDNGLWICYAGCGKGDIVAFHSRVKGIPRSEAEDELEVIAGLRKTVPEAEIADANARLLGAPSMLEHLKKTRGLSERTVRDYRLGYGDGRVWIPIVERGIIYNVKKHDITGKASVKTLGWEVGMSENRLFPYRQLAGEGLIFIMEGELKALLALELGLTAISVTTGAGSWRATFNDHFKDRDVAICYDNDDPGRNGAIMVASHLAAIAKSVRIIELPPMSPGNKDFPDYIIKEGHSVQDFLALLDASPAFKPGIDGDGKKPLGEAVKCSLSQASDKGMYFKKVEFNATVSGKDLTPFFAPRKVQLTCKRDQGEKCEACGMGFARGAMSVEFSPYSQDVLNMIRVTDKQQKGMVRGRAGIPASCSAWDADVQEVYNVEELRVIPEVDFSNDQNEYVTRIVYSVADKPVAPNKTYKMTGISLPDPTTQYATQVVNEVELVQGSADRFKMDEENFELLRTFRKREGQTVAERLAELTEDLTYNVTKIYQREDLVLAVLLVYMSVLRFKFNGQRVWKGWMELLVLGDTRAGKTETIKKLMQHLQAGEFVTGENTSFAGLVGGMSQEQKRWHITWGKIPLNNRGLLATDEAQGLPLETIAAMSGIRSSGVAEITKIQTERTEAQCRLIWLANPRSGRKLEDYSYGVLAIKELIGNAEDIARFDFAVTAASGEVELSVINARSKKEVPALHTQEAMSRLVLWAWSRGEEDVEFEDDATDAVLAGAMAVGERYSSLIPLVEPAEQRIKLARMSVALAGLLFSTDRSHQKVIVKKEHVEAAIAFLDACYKKGSMGYDVFSAAAGRTEKIAPEKAEKLKGQFVGFDNWRVLREVILSSHLFRKADLTDQIGYDKDDARILFKWLGSNSLVSSTSVGFRKQPAFTKLLKEINPDKPPKSLKLDEKEDEI